MHKQKIVIQEDKNGCQVACIATILGKTYKEIERHFGEDFSEEGISTIDTANYLAGYGFDLIGKYAEYFGANYDILKERLLEPFADIHIVSIAQFSKTTKNTDTLGHAIIMTKNGKLYCPANGKSFSRDSFLVVNFVLGCYYPNGWKFNKKKRKSK